ncbi:HoxN/HupN/NixA family nickel/cobalt transporter [Legionella tunisiensis]|uniref:HoxN/HupN/NixA family nickel/cobalt transporter n=1 Tax=Legionella tunisiensis TaxID=1034944 RepID=UPI001E406D44|nr:hypothetical protein [Legionella tunisiensis]
MLVHAYKLIIGYRHNSLDLKNNLSLKRIKVINTITNSTILIILFVFGLGLRHGLDLDHLATIDSITRATRSNNKLSKRAGFLFSLGHGLVVIILSVIISHGFIRSKFPAWLEPLGSFISIFFLLVFGFITLYNSLLHKKIIPGNQYRRFFCPHSETI